MKKKFFLLATCLSLGAMSFISAQQRVSSSDRSLTLETVDYGMPNQTYKNYGVNFKQNKITDNWTVTIAGGAQIYIGEDDPKGPTQDRITFAPQLAISKYFRPTWGLRVNFTGGSMHGFNDGDSGVYRKWNNGSKHYLGKGYINTPGYPTFNADNHVSMLSWDPEWNYMGATWESGQIGYDARAGVFFWKPGQNGEVYMQHMRFVQANIDFMFDLFGTFAGYNPERFFEITPFGGVGLYNTFAHRGHDNFMGGGVHAGLILKFRLTERFGVHAEFGGSLVPDDLDGQSGDNNLQNGTAQATLGLAVKLGKTDWDVVDPFSDDRIRNILKENEELRNREPEVIIKEKLIEVPVPVAKDNTKISKFLPDPVFFRLNSAEIDGNQWGTIDKSAKFLNDYPDANIILTGYADKETGTPTYNMKLSERRAKAVASILVKRFGINPARLSINWSGSNIQPFQIQEWNRVVVFVIEE